MSCDCSVTSEDTSLPLKMNFAKYIISWGVPGNYYLDCCSGGLDTADPRIIDDVIIKDDDIIV